MIEGFGEQPVTLSRGIRQMFLGLGNGIQLLGPS